MAKHADERWLSAIRLPDRSGGVVAALIAVTGQADWRALAAGMAVLTIIAGGGYLALRVAPQPALSVVRFADIRALLRLPRLALFNVAAGLYAAGQATFFAYRVLFARDAMAAPLALASGCLAIAHVASATGRVCGGVISDRLVRNGMDRDGGFAPFGRCAVSGEHASGFALADEALSRAVSRAPSAPAARFG
jgi:hypothetical protein